MSWEVEIGTRFWVILSAGYFLRRTFFLVAGFFRRADFFRTAFGFRTFFLTAALGLTRLAARGAGLRIAFLARLAGARVTAFFLAGAFRVISAVFRAGASFASPSSSRQP